MKSLFNLINKNFFLTQLYRQIFKKNLPISSEVKPLITLSREMGSGGKIIAQMVADQLGKPWKVYHKDLIEKIAKATKLEKKLVEEIDEKKRPAIEEIIYDLFGKKYANLNTYYQGLVRVMTEIGQRGYCIIIGRGANFLFPQALNVRIICQMEQRIKWEMEFEKISRSEAIRRIQESDEKRREFVKTLFHHDLKKAHHYDLIIRTGPDLDLQRAADLIVLAAKKRFHI